jgi:hypothetical protein
MPLEVWGTFSVADHKRPRAFVADVLLYDRLVIPVPPPDDVKTWSANGWEPEELSTRLEILGSDLARTVSWDAAQRAQFSAQRTKERDLARQRAAERFQMTDAVGFDSEIIRSQRAADPNVDPMYVTRLVLKDHANRKRDREFFERHPDVYVDALAAYPSFDTFRQEIEVETLSTVDQVDEQVAAIFGWEFFVPDDPTLSDEDLLEEAASLARGKEFRSKRAAFHEWRRELLEHGGDAQTAYADMERMIDSYREETSKARTKTRLLNAFTIAGGAATLAASFLFPQSAPQAVSSCSRASAQRNSFLAGA